MKVHISKFDASEHIKTDEDIAAYLEVVFDDGDPQLIAAAIGDIAKAKGMSQIAKTTGLTRASLYKSLSDKGNPELSTILKVVKALGIKIKPCPA